MNTRNVDVMDITKGLKVRRSFRMILKSIVQTGIFLFTLSYNDQQKT